MECLSDQVNTIGLLCVSLRAEQIFIRLFGMKVWYLPAFTTTLHTVMKLM